MPTLSICVYTVYIYNIRIYIYILYIILQSQFLGHSLFCDMRHEMTLFRSDRCWIPVRPMEEPIRRWKTVDPSEVMKEKRKVRPPRVSGVERYDIFLNDI